MKVIGLTGSIGMGKSVLTAQARHLGIPVHDADACVHDLMKPNGKAFDLVAQAFPTAIVKGGIDRKKLGQIVFHDPDKRALLEQIIHPLVRSESKRFIRLAQKAGHSVCILDIPLLFETGRDQEMDVVLTVSAPSWVQKRRVLARANMSEDKLKSIAKAQMPDYRKRLNSDEVVLSARGKRHTLNALKRIKKKYAEK